jgi:hypothetical protein
MHWALSGGQDTSEDRRMASKGACLLYHAGKNHNEMESQGAPTMMVSTGMRAAHTTIQARREGTAEAYL